MEVVTTPVDDVVASFINAHPTFRKQWDEIVDFISKNPSTAVQKKRGSRTVYTVQQNLEVYGIEYAVVREWYIKVNHDGKEKIIIYSVQWK